MIVKSDGVCLCVSQWTDDQKASLSSLMFLGKLLDAHPALSQTLTSSRCKTV